MTSTYGERFSDNKVVISIKSNNPYTWDTISRGVVVAQKAFLYHVSIPSWSTGTTISINGSDSDPCTPVDGLHALHLEPGTTKFTLNPPLDIVAGSSHNPQLCIL